MTLEELNAIEARAKVAGRMRAPFVEDVWSEELRLARSDVPALVAEVRRLRQQVAELEDEIDAACIERQ